jgi:hypothetical protein
MISFASPVEPDDGGIPTYLRPVAPADAVGVAHTAFAISRSRNFWILPVEVFGSSVNTT